MRDLNLQFTQKKQFVRFLALLNVGNVQPLYLPEAEKNTGLEFGNHPLFAIKSLMTFYVSARGT